MKKYQFVLMLAFYLLFKASVFGQVFVLNGSSYSQNSVAKYNVDGSLITNSLISYDTVIGSEIEHIGIDGDDLFVTNYSTVGEYTTSGSTVNTYLIYESSYSNVLTAISSIAVSNSNIFISTGGTSTGLGSGGSVGEFTTSGVTLNSNLISFGVTPDAIAVSGSYLFISTPNFGIGNSSTPAAIGLYTTSGSMINANLISGIDANGGLAVSGSYLFVANYQIGTIEKYTISGDLVNSNLISGLANISDISISGSNLFILSEGGIGKYDLYGNAINSSLISLPSLDEPEAFVVAVPEPSTLTLFWFAGFSGGVLFLLRRRRGSLKK